MNGSSVMIPLLILFSWLVVGDSILLPHIQAFGRDSNPHGRPLTASAQPVQQTDNRPHEQRANCPRPARRLNHAFKYLYRHDNDAYPDDMTALDYLFDQGYSLDQVKIMKDSFPPLLELSVRRHLHPKMRFLKETIGLSSHEQLEQVPPQYFGARLEAVIAPRHAFIVYLRLPHGPDLLQPSPHNASSASRTLLEDFLVACRDAKRFAALCQTWQQLYPQHNTTTLITPQQIKAFDALFARGLMAAARNEQELGLVYKEASNNTSSWPSDYIDIASGSLVRLLIQHGANPRERDRRGVTLAHWAAGTGNLEGLQELLPHVAEGVWALTERDGASPLHWAVAGCNARHFGTGGHVSVAAHLLSLMDQKEELMRYMNLCTKDGNTALMWAAWSGSLDCVKLLVESGADAGGKNRNGCTLAHWATSGGSLEVCKYLHKHTNADFTAPNFGGHTPLTHAVAFGRAPVVKWLRDDVISVFSDDAALRLAHDFVSWKEGDENRQQVLNLFSDWDS